MLRFRPLLCAMPSVGVGNLSVSDAEVGGSSGNGRGWRGFGSILGGAVQPSVLVLSPSSLRCERAHRIAIVLQPLVPLPHRSPPLQPPLPPSHRSAASPRSEPRCPLRQLPSRPPYCSAASLCSEPHFPLRHPPSHPLYCSAACLRSEPRFPSRTTPLRPPCRSAASPRSEPQFPPSLRPLSLGPPSTPVHPSPASPRYRAPLLGRPRGSVAHPFRRCELHVHCGAMASPG
ncbi:hypothetical protein C8R44DRAFT_260021 [Mycena epipterygia]|nr:hypothetical protein C8R44DRAFT_260021 [Mycena epipterygia]